MGIYQVAMKFDALKPKDSDIKKSKDRLRFFFSKSFQGTGKNMACFMSLSQQRNKYPYFILDYKNKG